MIDVDKKSISRERVIGISLVDILIQLIFVLFIALAIGYVDPEKKKELEFAEIGKDACTKINKNDFKACRQVIDNHIYTGNLQTCLKENTADKKFDSLSFLIISSNEVRFRGFTQSFFKYLSSQEMPKKLEIARSISPNTNFTFEELNSKFNFIKEDNCFHTYAIDFNTGIQITKEMNVKIKKYLAPLKKCLKQNCGEKG